MSFSILGNSDTFANPSTNGNFIQFNFIAGTIPAGTLIVLGWACNVASLTVTSVADDSTQAGAANTYVALTPRAGSSLTTGTVYCFTTRDITTADTVTITVSANASRRSGAAECFVPSNLNPVLDQTSGVSNATASPVTMAATGTQAQSNDLAVCVHQWKGGAVASGFSHSAPGGFTTGAGISSGGTTVRVETNIAFDLNLGSNAAITPAATYTSIAAGSGEVVTFTDEPPPPAAFAPLTAQASSQSLAARFAYAGQRSLVASAFDNNTAQAPTGIATLVQSRPTTRYRGSYSAVSAAADERLDAALLAPTVSRYQPDYAAPLARTIAAFTPNPAVPDAFAPVAIDRAPPFYRAPLAQTISVYDPATNTFRDWAPGATYERAVAFYLGPRSSVLNVFDPAGASFRDWAPSALIDRAPSFYGAPISRVGQVWFVPSVAPGTDWAAVAQSWRARNLYSAPYSSVSAAADEAIPGDGWASVNVSRRVDGYLGSYSYNASSADEPIDVWTSVTQSGQWIREVLRSVAVPVLGVGSAVPDTWAQTTYGKLTAPYSVRRGAALGVFTPTVVADAMAYVATSGPQEGVERLSSVILVPLAPPDSWAPGALLRVLGRSYTPPLSTTSAVYFSPALAAQGYAPVAQARGSLARLASTSLVMMPFDFIIVTPNPGGGGEWVIWQRPDFPGARSGAWKQFNTPNYRRPSRPEKRGY